MSKLMRKSITALIFLVLAANIYAQDTDTKVPESPVIPQSEGQSIQPLITEAPPAAEQQPSPGTEQPVSGAPAISEETKQPSPDQNQPADQSSAPSAPANVSDPIVISASADRQSITIGDVINYTISVEWDKGLELLKVEPGKKLGEFEIQNIHPVKDIKISETRSKREFSYALSTFDTGDYEIPPFKIEYKDAAGSTKTALSQSIPIKVNSVINTADAKTDIQDIKPPAKLPPPEIYKLAAIIAAAVLLIGIPLFFYIRKKLRGRSVEVELNEPKRPPHEVAYEELEKLSMVVEELMSKKEYKFYYSRLTEIIRIFFGARFGIKAIDMTTFELMCALADIIDEKHLLNDIDGFFTDSDMVKFAKFIPETESAKKMINRAKDILNKISPLPLEREEQKGEMAPSSPQKPAPVSSSTEDGEKVPEENQASSANSEEVKADNPEVKE